MNSSISWSDQVLNTSFLCLWRVRNEKHIWWIWRFLCPESLCCSKKINNRLLNHFSNLNYFSTTLNIQQSKLNSGYKHGPFNHVTVDASSYMRFMSRQSGVFTWNILMCVTAACRGRCEAAPNNNNTNQLRDVYGSFRLTCHWSYRCSDRFVSPPTGLRFNSTAEYELVLCSPGSHVSDGQVIWSSEWHHWEEMTSFKSQKKTESKCQSSETTIIWIKCTKCSCLLTEGVSFDHRQKLFLQYKVSPAHLITSCVTWTVTSPSVFRLLTVYTRCHSDDHLSLSDNC